MANENPKLFISYSWSTPEHGQWVLNLATELVENGIDVIFDKWHLKEGHDSIAFMEKMVTDSEIKKVIIICDRLYAEKADGRSGGVGTETQIISPEIYQKQDQGKFVAVLSEKDEAGNPYLPIYFKPRIYIDLSADDLYASNFEQLLRWIYDKPLYIKPPLGKQPLFLSEEEPISLGTTTKFRRAINAIRNNKEDADYALGDYLSTLADNLEELRITDKEGDFDEKVVNSIEKFLPLRNDLISIFLAISQYRCTMDTIQQLHRFMESLIPYMDKPKGVREWLKSDFDNFIYIIHELFLYVIACLLKYERFDAVSYLLRNIYYVEGNSEYGRDVMVPFSVFQKPVYSLETRNKRLELGRISLHADLLVKHYKSSVITDRQLMQSDLVLFLRDCFNALRNAKPQTWYPITLIYAEEYRGPFEIFARSQSSEYFNRLKDIFDIEQKDDFVPLFAAFDSGELRMLLWEFSRFDPRALIGFDKLASTP